MASKPDFSRNNLDCLRLILAAIVVLFHMHALTNLHAFSIFGKYCSPHFAIRSFFVISGFLIYRSYMRSSTMGSYYSKRVRRIYPAYCTVILVAAGTFWLVSTDAPLRYFLSLGFWKYVGANLLFMNFLAPSLPGVFTVNRLSPVDGALWTLKIEVAFYIIVPVIHWLCTRFGTKKIIALIFVFSTFWKYGFEWLAYLHNAQIPVGEEPTRSIYAKLAVQFPAQLVYFSAGILLLLYFDKLRARLPLVVVLTLGLFLSDQFLTHDSLDVFWISGIVLVFGFWKYLGDFSKHGDFSYGVYIVHWPILQLLIHFGVAQRSAALFFCLSVVLIALASFLLWHLVEKRFLATSSHYRLAAKPAQA
ncbi:MAG: acyltransferase [Terracidiphilus sp.]